MTITDTRAIILPDFCMHRRFHDELVRIDAARPDHVLDPNGIAMQMLFTGMGGPKFRSRLASAAIAAGTFPDLLATRARTNSQNQGGKEYEKRTSDKEDASDEEYTAIHIDNLEDQLPARSPTNSSVGSPCQRLRELQAITDDTLAQADLIVGTRLDETQAAVRRLTDTGYTQQYKSLVCPLPCLSHAQMCPTLGVAATTHRRAWLTSRLRPPHHSGPKSTPRPRLPTLGAWTYSGNVTHVITSPAARYHPRYHFTLSSGVQLFRLNSRRKETTSRPDPHILSGSVHREK